MNMHANLTLINTNIKREGIEYEKQRPKYLLVTTDLAPQIVKFLP